MRQTIAVKNAREHNLKNVDVEIPRDQLVVMTGLSGSGKSSLAFDTIYAEGQRRFLESLSAYARRFVGQLKKPAVDVVLGLSPVISIEQKTVTANPRSTVGTATDVSDYLRILYATTATAHCPYCTGEIPTRTAHQIAEHILALPDDTAVELRAPVFKIYGEDYAYLLDDVRAKGCRRVRVDGEPANISDAVELDEGRDYRIEAIADTFIVKRDIEKQLIVAIRNALRLGEGFLHVALLNPRESDVASATFYRAFSCPEHHVVMGEPLPYYYSFNDLDSACVTCLGLGADRTVHPDLLVPDKRRSIAGGAFVPEAFRYDKNSWAGRIMYSLARHYGFSLDAPFGELPPAVVDVVLYGTRGEKFEIVLPDGATKGDPHVGKLFRFDGIITTIERRYRRYRKEQVAHTHMETYIRKVTVEHTCPDCRGTRLKRQRLLATVGSKTIHELGELPLRELLSFLDALPTEPEGGARRQGQAGAQVIAETRARLDLLVGVGLNYLNLNRRAATLSGGESQRLRLSTQISSELMGMLYVLDEPSIGLHPRDNAKMIATLKRLRDIGNTVIVVEHDEETIRAADHVLELGPGPGIHGGRVVAQGAVDDLLQNPGSLTGRYLSGQRGIAVPAARRAPNGHALVVRGARENNLKTIDVAFPLGLFICVTGVSGSGKSSLVNGILYRRLYALFHDSRVLAGAHDTIEGISHIHDVINIDQSPIGRTPTSNPATYIGVYDAIRHLFADTPAARTRGYSAARFSFNVKGGRCEECAGRGLVTTQLHFMPDVETPCQTCKGARYNEETLEVTYRGKTIADLLEMTVEEAVLFLEDAPTVAHKLGVLQQLGLGYLRLGQSSTTISGGEAQRVKLAHELGKIKRGGRTLYILDEPTTGLHLADVQRLLDSLNLLVDAGNTVIVIEHHLDVIKTADWIIDLGPEGGNEGGEMLCCGTPEQVAAHPRSYTGQFLRAMLR